MENRVSEWSGTKDLGRAGASAGIFQFGKMLDDHRFDLLRIEIADRNHGHQVGPIPLVIKVQELLAVRSQENVRFPIGKRSA